MWCQGQDTYSFKLAPQGWMNSPGIAKWNITNVFFSFYTHVATYTN